MIHSLAPLWRGMLLLVLVVVLVPGWLQAQSSRKAAEDLVFLQDGTAINCRLMKLGAERFSYRNDRGDLLELPTEQMMSFILANAERLDSLDADPNLLRQKYYTQQDLFVLKNGTRLLADLVEVNSFYFLIRRYTNYSVIESLPHDSVYVFQSQKQVAKEAIDYFPALAKLYAGLFDNSDLGKMNRESGNWNPDYLLRPDGSLERVIITDADSVRGVMAMPAFFTPKPLTANWVPWTQILSLDYLEDPNPYRRKGYQNVLDKYREPAMKTAFSKALTGNLQFLPSRISDDIKETRRITTNLFLRGGVLMVLGMGGFGFSYAETFRGVGSENDARIVAGVAGMSVSGAVIGWGINVLWDASSNLRVYNRLKKLNASVGIPAGGGVGLSLRPKF